MRRAVLLLLVLLTCLSACFLRRDRPSPPAHADYTPPTWVVDLDVDPKLWNAVPTRGALIAEYDRVTRAWLDYWNQHSAGRYKPATIPGGIVGALVEISAECSNSAESPGRGAYGVTVYGWSCTHQRPKGAAFITSAVCHYLSHTFAASSGGNSDHALMSRVAGC